MVDLSSYLRTNRHGQLQYDVIKYRGIRCAEILLMYDIYLRQRKLVHFLRHVSLSAEPAKSREKVREMIMIIVRYPIQLNQMKLLIV